jgi:hypothetical protein
MASDLAALAEQFWTWRAATQPSSGDDIPRIERPPTWVPDWSPDAIADRGAKLRQFEQQWRALRADTIAYQVDYRLIGSALARVHWELDVLKGWQRNPHFYVHQTLTPCFEALLLPTVDGEALTRLLERIPETLQAAQANLHGHALQPFAQLAIGSLNGVRRRLRTMAGNLRFNDVPIARAAGALESYSEWLQSQAPKMPEQTAIGRDVYQWFLTHVALIPLSPEDVAHAGQQEWERSVSFETLEQQRNRGIAQLALPATQQEQVAREERDEQAIRDFCESRDLLSFPKHLRHYRFKPTPEYLAPLRGIAVSDDLTSPARLDQDGIHFIPEPGPDLPYFYLAMARDPRTLIAHEGVHYYQLARSWAHPNPIRRHYYDSGPNEGIGFYSEEMLLQAGLFDDSPRSREIIYSFMRLRALRVAVDVKLALGEFTIDTGAQELSQRVPMDAATAREEASFFASEPGQAITYQIGKLQILRFLSDLRLRRGQKLSLREFHDSLFDNGNVPISLQRWETLGLDDEIARLDSAGDALPL